MRLAAEPYGGVLQNPWFDRDLALAGRVHFRNPAGAVQGALVQLPEKLAIIPSLAIHLDREANQKRSINAQTDLPALFAFENDEATLQALLKTALEAAGHAVDAIAVRGVAGCAGRHRAGTQRGGRSCVAVPPCHRPG